MNNITFNSFDLQDSTYYSRIAKHRGLAQKNVITEDQTRRDGFRIVRSELKSKIITVEGVMKAKTTAALRVAEDNLKQNLRGNDKNLDIDDGGTTKRYKATVQRLSIPGEDFYHITHLPYRIEFLCHPKCTATSATTVEDNNITSSPHTDSFSITGSASPLPVITLTIDAESTMSVIKFKNTTTDTEITITRAFSAAEELEIDCENLTVKVGGTEVDFTGVFPEFDPNTNEYTITTTDGGAFNIDMDIVYYPTYL